MFWTCNCKWREFSHRSHCGHCGAPAPPRLVQHDPGKKFVRNTPAKADRKDPPPPPSPPIGDYGF